MEVKMGQACGKRVRDFKQDPNFFVGKNIVFLTENNRKKGEPFTVCEGICTQVKEGQQPYLILDGKRSIGEGTVIISLL